MGKKTGPNPTDRGKRGTKRSLLTDGAGVPIAILVAPANRHDSKLLRATLENAVLLKPEELHHLCGDKAYDSEECRNNAWELGYRPHIRSRREEDKEVFRGKLMGENATGE